MITEDIKIRGKYQFELKLACMLSEKEKKSSYDIETYFYFPSTLGVNKSNYKKPDFYSDIQTYIRFKTPVFTLQGIIADEESPLQNIRKTIENLANSMNKNNLRHYRMHLKMFTCILRSTLDTHIMETAKEKDSKKQTAMIDSYIVGVRKIQDEFISLKKLVDIIGLEERPYAKYIMCDEYLSLIIERKSYALIEALSKTKAKKKTYDILALVKEQIDYRISQSYSSIPEETGNNESFLYRGDVFKKFNNRVLFLNTRTINETKVLGHVAASISAGIAMIFATGAAFYFQERFGNLSFPFFVAVVTSYIFKDRIKDFTKSYLGSRMHRFFFDSKTYVYDSVGDKIGVSREAFHFLSDKKTDPMIKSMRNQRHITEIENDWMGENLIVHRKKINLYPKKIKKAFSDYEITAVHDITRFNLLRFVKNTDNPNKSVYVTDGKAIRKVLGDRNYHINVIVKYTEGKNLSFKRIRILFNRKGIKRIERIFSEEGTEERKHEMLENIHKILGETLYRMKKLNKKRKRVLEG
ncbi:MAG: hypothetical protein KKF44_04730 [Nanoarchaeota archaeon]|nr:hypothetical protein [Nanoarchaeota archaeon]